MEEKSRYDSSRAERFPPPDLFKNVNCFNFIIKLYLICKNYNLPNMKIFFLEISTGISVAIVKIPSRSGTHGK
jgi:hypothetical protein